VIATKDVPVFEQFFRSPFDNDPFFRQFFPEFQIPERRQKGTEKQQISAGTGFQVADDGFIITNKHVVSDEDAEYTVITKEGEKYAVQVLARDPVQDLAILKVEAGILSSITLGDSENLQSGQTVIAIGNALGEFQNTVSVGVISGLRRTIVASSGFGQSEPLEEVIQTDAAINPGNSGGPLLNLSGQAIGVNVAIASGAENIGFAIPINRAKKAIQDVQTKGKITYPFLGVRYVMISEDFAKESNLPVDYGALVVRGEEVTDLAVVPGSAADKAGVMENDIILEINGQKITQDNALANLIQSLSVGDTITIKILHRGEEKEVQATLGER
jgi:serine protease Do